MNSDYVPSEPGVYIVRQTEKETADTKVKKRGVHGKGILLATLPILVLVISVCLYGIENKAAAFEKPDEIVAAQELVDAVPGDITVTQETAAGVTDSVSITIRKNIPVAGGMGGGSSDAAEVLKMLNSHYKKLSAQEMHSELIWKKRRFCYERRAIVSDPRFD